MSDLAYLIETNNWERYKLIGRAPGYELYDGPDHLRVSSPEFSRVAWARFAEAEADECIAAIMEGLRSRGTPVVWQVGPASRPADLGARLMAYGLIKRGPGEAGMALELDRLRQDVPYHPTVTIRRAVSASDFAAFEELQALGFGHPLLRPSPALGLMRALGPDHPDLDHLRIYLGWLGHRPVATAMCFHGAGVAGLYGVATLPAYRRQGLATALTLHALREARADGYRLATLYASAMGVEVYRRLGFEVYCTIDRYVWTGEPA